MAEIIHIETLSATGPGVGKLPNGRRVEVWGALPGEVVAMSPTRRKKGTTIGVIESILTRSPHRLATVEPHFLSCSPWQIMTEAFEQQTKQHLVEEIFSTAGITLPEFTLVYQPPFLGYRNKMEFSFTQDERGVLSLAFFARASRSRLPIDSCRLAPSSMNKIAAALVEALRVLSVSSQSLKSLVLKSNAEGQTIAGLFLNERRSLPLAHAHLHKNLAGLSIIYSDPLSPASRTTAVLEHDGVSALTETVGEHVFAYGLSSFFQINVPLFKRVLQDIQKHVTAEEDVVDLYAGVGTIGLSLPTRRLTLVEIDEHAIPYLKENAATNNRGDAKIVQAPAEKSLEEIRAEAVLLLDPPRVGLHPKVIAQTITTKPKKIIYLSCHPLSQARDLKALTSAGYCLIDFSAYNFFPRTPHIETLAVLIP